MPYAIERSVARPTIRARLPARNPMGYCYASERSVSVANEVDPRLRGDDARASDASALIRDEHDQALARLDDAARAQFVPAEQIRQPHAELVSDPRQRVAPTHDVGRRASLDGFGIRRGEGRGSGNLQHLADSESVVAREAVAGRDALYAHAMRTRDAPQRVAAPDDVLVGPVARRAFDRRCARGDIPAHA